MKKVLLVAPYGGVPGGISRWTSHIVDYYKICGKDDCQLGLVPMGRTMFVNVKMSLFKRLWFAWIDYRKIFADFNRKIDSEDYDVMHLTSSASLSLYKDLYMLMKARKKGIKSVLHFRFGRIPDLARLNNWEWKLLKKAVIKTDKVIVIDQASYDTLAACGFKNIELLPNPLAPQVERVIAANCNLERQPRLILFAGHVVKTKGVFELLEACSSMANIHLRIVGYVTSEMRKTIEDLYGCPEWLTLCGEKPYEEVIKDMMACDVFVLPTHTEGFPNVILEAMVTGCAIISTPVGAIPQMLEDEGSKKFGLLVEPRNAKELHDAILSLIDNETMKNEMRGNVQKRVRERYNIQAVWNNMVSIWESC